MMLFIIGNAIITLFYPLLLKFLNYMYFSFFLSQVWVPQRILSQRSQRMVRQAPRVHSTLGQFCGPAQVFQTPQLWRDVPEGCKKRGNLQQQLYLHLLGSDPVLHVRPLKGSNFEFSGHSAYKSSTKCYVTVNDVINSAASALRCC